MDRRRASGLALPTTSLRWPYSSAGAARIILPVRSLRSTEDTLPLPSGRSSHNSLKPLIAAGIEEGMPDKILVTGATGNAGGEVLRQLAALGHPVRALVRNPAKAGPIKLPNVELAQGDLEKPE